MKDCIRFLALALVAVSSLAYREVLPRRSGLGASAVARVVANHSASFNGINSSATRSAAIKVTQISETGSLLLLGFGLIGTAVIVFRKRDTI